MKEDHKNITEVSTEIINLIDGQFTGVSAEELLLEIIDKKINFHKIKKLSNYEKDHNDPCEYDNNRIEELESEKNKIARLFKTLSVTNSDQLKIHGQLIIQMGKIQ